MFFGPVSSVGHAGRGDAVALSFLNPHGTLTPSQLSLSRGQIASQHTILQMTFSHLASPSNSS